MGCEGIMDKILSLERKFPSAIASGVVMMSSSMDFSRVVVVVSV